MPNKFKTLTYSLKHIVFFIVFALGLNSLVLGQNENTIEDLNSKIQNSQEDTVIAKAYYELAELLYRQNIDTIFPLCEQSVRILKTSLSKNPNQSKEQTLHYLLAKNYILIAYGYTAREELKKALDFNEKALYILSDLPQKDNEIGQVYNNLSVIYSNLGAYKKASEYNDFAIPHLEKSGNYRSLAYTYNNAAVLFYKIDDFEKSENYILKSIQFNDSIDDDVGKIRSNNTYGSLLKKKGDTSNALDKYKKALELSLRIGFDKGAALSYNNIGVTCIQLKNFDQAKINIQKAIELLEKIGYKFGLANAYQSMGELLLKKKKYTEAEEYLQKALDIAQKYNYNESISETANLLSTANEYQQDWKAAYDMSQLYYSMKAKVDQDKRKKENLLFEIQAKKELEQQERIQERIIHEKEMEIVTEKNNTQRIFILFTSAGLLIAALFSLILFQKLKTSRRQKAIIEKQSDEQKLLLQEIHHRVKNNFQIISSLLKLQSIQENDPKIEDEFNKAINRISSMAVVHEVIYGQTQFSEIDVTSYFNKLIENLQKSFADANGIDITFSDGNNAQFNMQTLIPLGISVNELITNSIKHAFIDQEVKKIEIDLIQHDENQYELIYKDNGIGIIDNDRKSFGTELINTIIDQIDGKITYQRDDQWKTYIVLRFAKQ